MKFKPQRKGENYDNSQWEYDNYENIKEFVVYASWEKTSELRKGKEGQLLDIAIEYHNKDETP